MLRFVICDDNHNHNRHMAKRLAQIIFDHQVDATIELVTTDPAGVVEYSRLDIPPRDRNVYLLDINLRAESDGIEVAQQIREHDKLGYLIFITAYPEHVMRSVNLKIFNYVLKPLTKSSLSDMIIKVYEDYMYTLRESKKISVQSGSRIYILNAEDILYIESFRNQVVIHEKSRQLVVYDTLSRFEKELSSEGFYRCHRSYLVNLRHIARFDTAERQLMMSNGDICLVAERHKKGILKYVELG